MLSPKQFANIERYLERYSEPEAALIKSFTVATPFEHALVIPAFREDSAFIERLEKDLLKRHRVLVVVVINQPDSTEDITDNLQLLKQLLGKLEHCQTNHHLSFGHWKNTQSQLLIVERFQTGNRLDANQGVGLARKIGVDVALAGYSLGWLKHHWIHNTDADTQLPADYFMPTHHLDETVSALTYPFQHRLEATSNNSVYQATRLYEQALHYYVEQLWQAGSPYAFHTLGSCIAVNGYHYASVRGFPKRAAGEDFYLLNKLAKLGSVVSPSTPFINIQPRCSNRVPFGTGPAVEAILQLANPEEEFCYYSPASFQQLRQVLVEVPQLFGYQQQWELWLDSLPAPGRHALEALCINTLFKHLKRQANNESQCIHYFHEWFDGFKTLKFIHQLRDTFPDTPLKATLSSH